MTFSLSVFGQGFKVLVETIKRLYQYRWSLLKGTILPFILCVVLVLLVSGFINLFPQGTSSWLQIVLLLVVKLVLSLVIIRTYRILLLGPSSNLDWGLLAVFNKRTITFFALTLVIILLHEQLPAITFLVGGIALFWIVKIALWFITVRLALVLPAIAIDDHWTIKSIWKVGAKHNGLLLFASSLIMVLPAIFMIPVGIAPFFGETLAPTVQKVAIYTGIPLGLYLAIAVYGVMYEHLGKHQK